MANLDGRFCVRSGLQALKSNDSRFHGRLRYYKAGYKLTTKHLKGENMVNSNESGKDPGTTRREFLKNTGRIAATSALAAGLAPRIYAAGSGTIKVALVGCGGRGTGAASNALSVKNGPIKLVAMADVFQRRLDRSYRNLEKSRDHC